MEVKAFIKSHKIAIILAVIVGLVSVAPQIYVLKDQNYRGIQMFGTDAEYMYVGEINRALYEDYSKGPFPVDPGKNYYLAPKLGQRIMAFFAKIFSTRAIEINVALKFAGPILLFLILYGWLLEIFSLRLVALIAPLFVILGINLLSPIDVTRLSLFKTSIDSFLPYTRPISPLISSIFLFLGLWGIYRLAYNKMSFKAAGVIGVLIGLSLYEYIYTWTFIVVVLGLYLLCLLVKKEWEKFKYFFVVFAVNGLVALPFFVNLLRGRSDEDYIYTTSRLGLIHTHAPILGAWVVLGFLFIIFLWPTAYQNTKYFFIILFGALAVVLNQQLVTGFQIQPGHYHWFTTKPLIAIILTFLGLYWIEKIVPNKKWRIVVVIFLVSIFSLNAIIIQARSYSANYTTYKENQRYAPLLTFLDESYTTKKNIWANPDLEISYPELSYLILAYTHHNAPMVLENYSNSKVHIRDMLFLDYRLHGINDKNIINAMYQDRNNITSALFGIYYRDMPGNYELSDVELQKLGLEYNEFYKIPLDKVFKSFKIDLIIADNGTDSNYFNKLPFLSKVYAQDGLFLYQ